MAACAASLPASSVRCSRRVPVDQPLPLAPRDSTMAVTKAVIMVDSSVCTRGRAVETIAMRSCRMVTSPPRMRPSRRSPSSLPASSASREEFTKVRSAPFTIVHPDSTRRSSETAQSSPPTVTYRTCPFIRRRTPSLPWRTEAI